MKKLISLIVFLSSFSVFSNSYIICAQKADFDEYVESGEVIGFELALSSEDDDYNGAVGGNWHIKFESEDSEWLSPTKNIVAKTSERSGDEIVEISITNAMSATGPVGTRYKLISLYDEAPILEKYTMGGFTGSIKIATFECVGSYD